MLQARLFGYFSLHAAERTVTLPTDKARALLAYLLAEHGQPQPRSRLAAMFWPDLPERRGLHNLTNALLALRRIAADLQLDLLIDTPQTVTLNVQAIDCDLWRAAALTRRMSEHEHRLAAYCPACAVLTEQYLQLISEPFLFELELDGCTAFTDWQLEQRERQQQVSIDLRKQQAAFLARCGRLSEARTVLLSVLRAEPWREEVFRDVMVLSSALGERSSALRQYQRGVETLRRHLNAEPEPATVALATTISSGRWRPTAPPWQEIPALPTAFFGRTPELTILTELLTDRRNRLITLLGPGGAGKTYLATAAARRAAPAFGGGTVFVTLAESESSAAAVLRIVEAMQLELMPVFPPLQQLLRRLSEAPWLLVLDNLEQIADADQLVNQLLTEQNDVVVLATSRRALGLQRERLFAVNGFQLPDDGSERPDNALGFLRLRTAAIAPHLELTSAETALIGLCRLTGGLPLALEMAAAQLVRFGAGELLQALERELDVLQRRAPDLPERHHRISVVFQRSWRDLPDQLKHLLAVLTLCRSPFDDVTATAVSGTTTVAGQLQELRLLGLVLQSGTQHFDLHPLLRQFVEQYEPLDPQELTDARRRHQQRFLQLLAVDELQRPDERTLPYVRAHSGQFSDIRAALQFAAQQQDSTALIAALRGLQQFCMFLGWFELGLQLTEEATVSIAADQPAIAADLLLRAGILALHAGRRERVAPLIEQALAWHRDAVTETQAGSLTATIKTELRDFSGAIADFEQLRARRNDLPTDIAAYLTYSHSRVLMLAGRLDEAEVTALESREFALAAGDVRTLALVDSALAQIPARAGDDLRALPRYEQALQSGRRLGLSFVLWVTLGNYAHSLAHTGREPEHVRALLAEWEAMTRASRDDFRLALTLASSVTTYLKIGDVDRAELQLCSSMPLMLRIPHPELDRLLLEAVSQLGRERGLHEIAVEALRIQLGHPETQPGARDLARQQLDPAIEPYNESVDALNLRIRALFHATAEAFNVTFA